MRISKVQFEKELDSLINAAKFAASKETARDNLRKASNKIDGYDNIPYDEQKEYRRKIQDAERDLGL